MLATVPGIISNNRLGGGYQGDTQTPEQHIPPRGWPGQMFEVCMTMNDTWGFKKNDHNWKSATQILRNLSDISSQGGKLLLPTLKQVPLAGRVLKTKQPVKSKATPEGVLVTLPGTATDPDISVVALDFKGPLTITQLPSNSPGQDGKIELDAFAADVHGGYTGTIKLIGSGATAHLGGWSDPTWWLEYVVNAPADKKWLVTAEVAATHPSKLTIGVGKETSV